MTRTEEPRRRSSHRAQGLSPEAQTQARKARSGNVWMIVGTVGMSIALAVLIAWWLTRPAKNGTVAVTATTGSLTLVVLCGEQLIWDFGPGRVAGRSVGTDAKRVDDLTLTLYGGSRVQVESIGPGSLNVAVEPGDSIAKRCGSTTPVFRVTQGGTAMEDDPEGISYVAELEGSKTRPNLSYPLSGHVVLGQVVQQGGGWPTRAAGILESGTVTLRVVPTFSDERVTLSSERLDEGSLFDTHACLKSVAESDGPCPAKNAVPAVGFARVLPEGGLKVQLYAGGPVGLQAFGAGEQLQLKIPNSNAAWQSELIRIWGSLVLLLLGFWKQLMELAKFVVELVTNPRVLLRRLMGGEDKEGGVEPKDDPCETAMDAFENGPPRYTKAKTDEAQLVLAILGIGIGWLGLVPGMSRAEPVEIKQDQYTGAGYSFRRGTSCLVVTANHVVKEMGVPITVLDRTGAKTSGSRTWSNEAYDLALVALPDNSPVACTALWPDSAWLRRASFGPKSEFRAIRHYPGGQEVIVFLKPAGGDKDRITLAPADATSIRESDSGSIVELDGKLVGIVQSVATETQRISVLRFDRIDDLVGDRFRASAGQRVVSFAGVLQQGQPKPNWSTFVQAWISEKTGSTVISTATAANAVPKPVCDVKVDVVAWDHVAAPNPERSALALQEKACGKKGWIYEQLCKQAKDTKSTAPAHVASQKIALNVTVTPTGAAPLTKLVQETHTPANSKLTAAEIESATLRAAVGPALTDLFERGGCN